MIKTRKHFGRLFFAVVSMMAHKADIFGKKCDFSMYSQHSFGEIGIIHATCASYGAEK